MWVEHLTHEGAPIVRPAPPMVPPRPPLPTTHDDRCRCADCDPDELIDLVRHDYPAAVDWILAHSFATPPTGYRREGIRRQLLRIPRAVTLADYRACNAFDIRADLEQTQWSIPTVILCGQEDQMTPLTYSAFLKAHMAGAQLGLIENAGHMAPVEQPAAWVAAVQRLWAQVATETRPAPGAE